MPVKVKGAKTSKPKPRLRKWTHTLDVTGLKFRWTKDGRRTIAGMIEKRGSINGIRLVREPNNKFDENAIMVCLPEKIIEGKQLGYLRATAAELLAPRLDDKTLVVVSARLEELYSEQDYNEGRLYIVFGDKPKAKRAKGKKPAKTGT